MSINSRWLLPERDTRLLLLKWLVALLVPVMVFTFWSGEGMVNNVLLWFLDPNSVSLNTYTDTGMIIQTALFTFIFYATVIALAGYLLAADSGRHSMFEVWLAVLIFIVAPLVLVIVTQNLLIGLAIAAVEWLVYFLARSRSVRALIIITLIPLVGLAIDALIWLISLFAPVTIFMLILTIVTLILLATVAAMWLNYLFIWLISRIHTALHYTPPVPLSQVQAIDTQQRKQLINRARSGGLWFATMLALAWLVTDIIYVVTGPYPPLLYIWIGVRTFLLPILGYVLGQLGGLLALRHVISPDDKIELASLGAKNGKNGKNGKHKGETIKVSRTQQLEQLSSTRAEEQARNLVPNDHPLQSKGAWSFYLLLLLAFVILYPVLDPIFFGFGTAARIDGYNNLGYYIILALGLNIVVGFAGLLDLGYVAFFVIGTYSWAMIGSSQVTKLLNLALDPNILPWLFWPMLLIGALIAALWGLLLGAPTLRLRGDYLAIVTLGFGEIIPLPFKYLDKITGGTNGLVGISPPTTPCAGYCFDWTTSKIPYYYLILALIVLSIFVNVRLRDSRLGRAWVAMREDEIAASSSGINLVRTKLFAFAAGAFFSGIAGVFYSAKLGSVSPSSFNTTDSIVFLAMVVIGGLGSIQGVIVGATVVYSINLLVLNQLDTIATNPGNILFTIEHTIPNFTFGNIRYLLFGIILICIMIFRPEGLIPSARRRRELHQAAEEEAVTVDPLDANPGSADFAQETRVE
jgi:ABC-type branched-subunit amino acid transport system permease subunit